MLERLKAWLFPDEWGARMSYLQHHFGALSDEERIFIQIMQKRLDEGLPLLERHKERLKALEYDLWEGSQW